MITEETDKQFVERIHGLDLHWPLWEADSNRLFALALRGAKAIQEDGAPKTKQQNGTKIAAEQIPFPVQKALRKTLLDGETDERRAIAAALNAWPGMGISEKTDYYSTSRTSPPVSTVTPQIVLPLPQKKGPP